MVDALGHLNVPEDTSRDIFGSLVCPAGARYRTDVNDRLRSAMLKKGIDSVALAKAVGVSPKTVSRWLHGIGRAPHRPNREAVAAELDEDSDLIWPSSRPDQEPGAIVTAEVITAYGHRVDVPLALWETLLDGAHEQIDILGYSFLFILEQHVCLPEFIEAKCSGGCKVRIALADPECEHVAERDQLEQLNGTLAGRIRNALNHLNDLRGIPGVEIALHSVHLYNAVYRFDDQMIVTPYLYRARGYQHPALHLRKLSPFGVFAAFGGQFEEVWATARRLESPAGG